MSVRFFLYRFSFRRRDAGWSICLQSLTILSIDCGQEFLKPMNLPFQIRQSMHNNLGLRECHILLIPVGLLLGDPGQTPTGPIKLALECLAQFRVVKQMTEGERGVQGVKDFGSLLGVEQLTPQLGPQIVVAGRRNLVDLPGRIVPLLFDFGLFDIPGLFKLPEVIVERATTQVDILGVQPVLDFLP